MVHRVLPAVLAFVGVGVPTAILAAVAVWLGAALVGALVSVLVVVAGVLMARGPVPIEVERAMIRDAIDHERPLSRAQVRRRARRTNVQLGCAVALAGGVGLAITFAAQ